jgi:hypothetical protein
MVRAIEAIGRCADASVRSDAPFVHDADATTRSCPAIVRLDRDDVRTVARDVAPGSSIYWTTGFAV